MQIQVNTDNVIQGREDVQSLVERVVTSKLGALSGHLTRVEVHVGDENGQGKGGRDKRCTAEARPRGRDPVAATDRSDTIERAVAGAVNKLRARLDTILGKAGRTD